MQQVLLDRLKKCCLLLAINPNKERYWKKIMVLAFLAFTVWIAHSFYFRHFGLYEDDYAHVAPAMGWDLPALLRHARVFVTWPHGVPIHFFLPALFSFIGTRLGGLHVLYIVGFIIVTLNAFLFYIILRRTGSEVLALTGALAFCLFPAHTTQTFLTHALGKHTSLTFLLVASSCYLLGERKISYLVILGALLTYEPPFMVFFGIPLLKRKWDRSLLRELVKHALILIAIILCVITIRKFTGESRVAEVFSWANILLIPLKILIAVVIGPVMSMLLFLYGPARTLLHWNMEIAIASIASLAVFLWGFHRLRIDSIDEKKDYPLSFHSEPFTLKGTLRAPVYYSQIARLFVAGIVMLCLAYLVSFSHFPPTARYGRGTSVHLAATFGGSIIFACICSVVVSVANAYRLKKYAFAALALYLSLVVGYRFSIQMDFKQSWQNQKWFWTNVIENCPDMTDGTVIFVIRDDLPKTRYIQTNSWADPFILQQVYQFPKHWENPPRVLVVDDDWTQEVIMNGEQWTIPWATYYEFPLQDSNVILLQMVDDKLVRSDEPITINGQTLELKPMEPVASPPWEKGALFRYLIEEGSDNDPG